MVKWIDIMIDEMRKVEDTRGWRTAEEWIGRYRGSVMMALPG